MTTLGGKDSHLHRSNAWIFRFGIHGFCAALSLQSPFHGTFLEFAHLAFLCAKSCCEPKHQIPDVIVTSTCRKERKDKLCYCLTKRPLLPNDFSTGLQQRPYSWKE